MSLTTATGPAFPLSYAVIHWAFGFIVVATVLRVVIPPAHLNVLQKYKVVVKVSDKYHVNLMYQNIS